MRIREEKILRKMQLTKIEGKDPKGYKMWEENWEKRGIGEISLSDDHMFGNDLYCIVLMGWSLLPNSLRPFQIYCAPLNLDITRT